METKPQLKSFKSLNVPMPSIGFEGTKIDIQELIDRDIILHDFKIEDSKFPKPGKEKCLHLQVAIGEIKYVSFTPTLRLIRQATSIEKGQLPITTKIIRAGKSLEFS